MTAADFWEQRYAQRPRVWSGSVNTTLAAVARGLVVGTALDLGCGEGGDAIWLARGGWQVTAVDISTTALERARTAAAAAGVPDGRIDWVAADLACMKPTALFVNTSRMRLIENGALVAALRAGRPGAAAVDVYEEEPVLGAEHPLLHMPNVLCTPHLGYAVQEKFEGFYRTAAENILAFAAGRPSNVYNEEALARR